MAPWVPLVLYALWSAGFCWLIYLARQVYRLQREVKALKRPAPSVVLSHRDPEFDEALRRGINDLQRKGLLREH